MLLTSAPDETKEEIHLETKNLNVLQTMRANYRSMGDTKGGAEWRITSWCEEQYEARSIPHYPPKADYSLYSLGSGVY